MLTEEADSGIISAVLRGFRGGAGRGEVGRLSACHSALSSGMMGSVSAAGASILIFHASCMFDRL